MLAVASIGSLRLRHWARNCMLVYAVCTLFRILAHGLFTYTYMLPNMSDGRFVGTVYYPTGKLSLIYVTAGLIVLGLIFPICALYFFNRPHVKDAFNGIFPVSPTNFPVEFPSQQ